MDVPVIWAAVGAFGSVAAAGVAVWAARLSRNSAAKSNAAAESLAEIERDRRRSELTPQFRITVEPWSPGSRRTLRLSVAFIGPPGLDRLGTLIVRIRDDHYRRGEGQQLAGGPTDDEIKAQIWGPWRFRPGTGPDNQLADKTGRVTAYGLPLPVGEELPFLLEPTTPPPWATSTSPQQWQTERGNIIRLVIAARRADHGWWTLPAEIDLPTSQHWRGVVPQDWR
jgi:hypothetical protein